MDIELAKSATPIIEIAEAMRDNPMTDREAPILAMFLSDKALPT
jgi:hypothetical protein